MIGRTSFLIVAAVGLAGAAYAQDATQAAQRAHETRAHHMQLYAFNLGPLVGMARGDVVFDAEVAAAHAGNIAGLASLDQRGYWVEGSDSESLADSRALPAVWENMDDVMAKTASLAERAAAAEQAAAGGQEAFVAAFGAVGQACGACHEIYRAPE